VELRKAKKEDMLSKRRNVNVVCDGDISDDGGVGAGPLSDATNRHAGGALLPMAMLIEGLTAPDPEVMYRSVLSARKLLSKESNPPIDDLIDSGAVPNLVEMLKMDTQPKIQFEAAWALTNIASGTSNQTNVGVLC